MDAINKHPGLLEISMGLEGLVSRSGIHACFAKGSYVYVHNGVKSIEEIEIGEEVLCSDNKYHKVLKTLKNEPQRIYKLYSKGLIKEIETTYTHPFLVLRNDKIQWMEYNKLQIDDRIGIPINTRQEALNIRFEGVKNYDDLIWFFGRFVGDGWIEERKRYGKIRDCDKDILLCCSAVDDGTEFEICKEKLDNIGLPYRYYRCQQVWKFVIHNIELLNWMKCFGKYAHGKTIPDCILNMSNDKLLIFLEGYLSADGNLSQFGTYNFKTVSPHLASRIAMIYTKLYNNYATMSYLNTKGTEIIRGRTVNVRDKFQGYFSSRKHLKKDNAIVKDGYVWFPISKIEETNRIETVYNLCVEEDNTFIVNGCVVHNCGINVLNHPIYYNNALMKAPNGTEITQFDLGDSDYLGGLKMDCLTVEALDKIHKCMDLLLKDGYMDWQGSLRKTYDKYLHPDVLDRDSSKMWDIISKNKMIDAFQMDSTVAKQSLAAIKPTTIPQLAQLNTLMRLMPEKGEKTPVEEYVEFKEHPNKLKEDIYKLNATEEEKKILYDFMKPYGGILDSQESAMLAVMLPFTNYDVPHANKIRKIIAKKKLKEVDAAREEYYKIGLENGVSKDILWYIWDVNIKRQMAYSFSLPHTTAYSLICLQEMNLSYYYPPIYWATAVLTVNAGALENEESTTGTNYKKVASAIGRIQTEGYEVKLPAINEAGFAFTPSAKENSIIYGLKGISEINDDFIKIIIQNRPYTSIEDFIEKCQPQKKQIINLIKAGAFNEFGDRRKIMKTYLASICPKKARITLQNMSLLIEYSLIPKDLQNYVYLFNFNRYIKQYETPEGFKLDQRARSFVERNYGDLDYETGFLDKKVWKKTYDKAMGGIKEWFKDNEEELINKIQEKDIEKIWNQYCQGSNSAWEMEVLGFYHSPHELLGLKADVVNPKNLVDGNYRHTVNIAGTVLGKDAYKHMVTILTTYGVVDLKFTNEQFAEYNRTISEVRDGVKKVLEKSWFIKGTLVFVKGFKSGETFRVKQISKIIDIDNKGVPKMTRYRYGKY